MDKRGGFVQTIFVEGPDVLFDRAEARTIDTLLSWPMRLLATAALGLIAWRFSDTGIGQQLAWGLHVGALSATAIVASVIFWVAGVDAVIAALWFVPRSLPFERTSAWRWLHVITWVNRQVGHVIAFFPCFVLSFGTTVRLPIQTACFCVLSLLGVPLLNGLAACRTGANSRADLLWNRRFYVYGSTALGLAGMAIWLEPRLAALLLGVLIRSARHRRRNKQVQRSEEAESGNLERRARFRQVQAAVGDSTDIVAHALLALGLVALVGVAFWQRQKLDAEAFADLDGPTGAALGCYRDEGTVKVPTFSMMLLADTQSHDLNGDRFPGQTEIAEAFVASARRPVVLDMLSGFAVQRFGELYKQRGLQHWAHLGDLADNGCVSELSGTLELLKRSGFDQEQRVGIAIGNHELAFDGSFHSSPYWKHVCSKSAPLTVRTALDTIAFNSVVDLKDRQGSPIKIDGRPLVAIFLNTSDPEASDWGMPGSIGAVSQEQVSQIKVDHVNPLILVFSHFPYRDLAVPSRERVENLLARLDEKGPNVLALLSAHTHNAAAHRHCIRGNSQRGRVIREITIGSTTDAPQQVAILDVGKEGKQVALQVKTLQAIGRPDSSCEPPRQAIACQRAIERMTKSDDCKPLLGPDTTRDCSGLQRRVSLGGKLSALRAWRGPRGVEEKRRVDVDEAGALLSCVCRDGQCANWGEFDIARLEQVANADSKRREELVCLGWAASALQRHKETGMTLREAVRCAFDDPTLPAERVFTATLENEPCY